MGNTKSQNNDQWRSRTELTVSCLSIPKIIECKIYGGKYSENDVINGLTTSGLKDLLYKVAAILTPGTRSFPKELVEIFAIQQRRKRACHARLILCTTAISNTESTLANFKNEVQKEEAAASKAYLHGIGLGKDKTAVKKVLFAIPRSILNVNSSVRKEKETSSLVKPPQIVENTWSTLTCKGMKKARVTLGTKAQVAPVRKVTQSLTIRDKSTSKVSSTAATTD
ncbi:hypothetical protein EPUL_000861 [Erysiphe pulchra]|uniref:Uncharacterized protein n=1 Tax=Erysiphe pulchra TaxID=225359 RepID=A0A2S4PZJ1_9PEZI|nr:hypothetical protein EPUL_000861 [Erysiphe pulchra]